MSNLKLIEVVKKDSGEERQSIYTHTDLTSAIAAMDNDFGAQVKDETTVKIYCIVIDNDTGEKIDGCCYPAPKIDMNFSLPDEEEPVVDNTIKYRVYTHNDYSEDNIAAYETERLAIGNYNTKKSASMRKLECNHALTVLIDGNGNFVEYSNWTRPIEE